jgi:hypothetical protein
MYIFIKIIFKTNLLIWFLYFQTQQLKNYSRFIYLTQILYKTSSICNTEGVVLSTGFNFVHGPSTSWITIRNAMLLDEEERAVPFLDGRHRPLQGASKLVHERRLASRPDALLRLILLDSYTGPILKAVEWQRRTVGSDRPHRERAPPELECWMTSICW